MSDDEMEMPDDLLLLIAELSVDATTVVRWAAACRTLRRAILEPAFRRRLVRRAEANNGGLDPALLLGVSFREVDDKPLRHRAVVTSASTHSRLRFDSGVLVPFRPVAARDSLLVLRTDDSGKKPDEICPQRLLVCDTVTGRIAHLPLPPVAVSYLCPHVLLTVGEAGSSFELLAMERVEGTQIYSSDKRQWSALRETSLHAAHDIEHKHIDVSRPVVVGRNVFWLCALPPWDKVWKRILSLDVDLAEETLIDLPQTVRTVECSSDRDNIILAAVHGELRLLVKESLGISVWTPTADSWTRQMVVPRREVQRCLLPYESFHFKAFGERSGFVILKTRTGGLLRLDLGSKLKRGTEEAAVVVRFYTCVETVPTNQFHLHETDLSSMLLAMKPF